MPPSDDAPMTSPSSPPVQNTDTPRTPTPQAPLVRRLSVEWQHRTMRAVDLRRVRAWQLPGGAIATLDDVLDRCGVARSPEPATQGGRHRHDPIAEVDHDAYLIDLLRLARTDELAARIVLQRILPALAGVARRHTSNHHGFSDLLDDLVANSWASIRTYPVERRPRRVVANLVRDIGFQTIVRPARRRNATEMPVDHAALAAPEVPGDRHPLVELVELLGDAERIGVLSAVDVQLIRDLIRLGRPEHLAVLLDVTPRTVRNHRDAVVHRLRTMTQIAA